MLLKEYLPLLTFIISSAGTIVSVSYIIKCWIFKLGDEIQTKCQDILQPKHFHNVIITPKIIF